MLDKKIRLRLRVHRSESIRGSTFLVTCVLEEEDLKYLYRCQPPSLLSWPLAQEI